MDSINKLKGMRATLVAELQANAESERFSKSLDKKLQDSINDVDAQIVSVEKARDYSARMARPAETNSEQEERTHGFKNFGDFLKGVMHAGITRTIDDRLTKFPSAGGMGETDPSTGGFAIPPEFFRNIITKTYNEGTIASKVFRLPVGESNGLQLPLIDEQSRVTGSRWGGVSSQWVSEGATMNFTAPKYRLLDLRLNKLMSLWSVTSELMADAPAVSAIAERAFGLELTYMIEDAILNSDGVGKPQGILQSAARFTSSRATPNTIVYADVIGMVAHMWTGSMPAARWYASQSIIPQLYAITIGSSSPFPMFIPPGAMSQEAPAMLFGKPLEFVEQCQGLGTEGDLIFADLSQYALIDKSAPQFESSMHILFLSDQQAFRATYRVDGRSMWATTLTPAYGSSTKSPFITLHA